VTGNTVLTICGKTKKVRMKSELSCHEDNMIDLVFVNGKNSKNGVAERISLIDAQDNSSKQMGRMGESSKRSNESEITREDEHNKISRVTVNDHDHSVEQSILTNSDNDISEERTCLRGVKETNESCILRDFNSKKSTNDVSETSTTLYEDSDDSTICEDSDEFEDDEILGKLETQSNTSVNYTCHTSDCKHVTHSFVDVLYHDQSESDTESHAIDVIDVIDENHIVPVKKGREDDNEVHTDKKIFVCAYPGCNKSYTYLKSFVIHQQAHNGKKPYVCDEPGCGRGFNTSNSLKSHTRVHRGEKPFKCDYANCKMRFTHLRGMACHKKRKHSDITEDVPKAKR
ncbi:5263_t:CDS:2, partial [Cetraspora pellucida]